MNRRRVERFTGKRQTLVLFLLGFLLPLAACSTFSLKDGLADTDRLTVSGMTMKETVEISDPRIVDDLKIRLGALSGGWKTQYVTAPSPEYVLVFYKGKTEREVVFLGRSWIGTSNRYRNLSSVEVKEIVAVLHPHAE